MRLNCNFRTGIFALAAAFAMQFFSAPPTYGAPATGKENLGGDQVDLNQIIPLFEVNQIDLHSALLKITEAGFSVGLVLDKIPPVFSIKLKEPSIRQVLDAIIAKAPDYEWNFSSGVIHVKPRNISHQAPLDNLERTIAGFSCHEYDVTMCINLLARHAQRSGFPVYFVDISSDALRRTADMIPEDARISAKFERPLKLIDALDTLILMNPPGHWHVHPVRNRTMIAVVGGVSHGHVGISRHEKKLEIERRKRGGKTIRVRGTPIVPK